MKSVPLIFKGEVVECPKCELEIGTITRDLFPHERFTEECIRGKYYQPKNGELCNCRECGEPWMNFRQLYLRAVGWTG
jgi:hypothetical protein